MGETYSILYILELWWRYQYIKFQGCLQRNYSPVDYSLNLASLTLSIISILHIFNIFTIDQIQNRVLLLYRIDDPLSQKSINQKMIWKAKNWSQIWCPVSLEASLIQTIAWSNSRTL